MKVKGDAREIIEQYIYYFGVWEPHITAWISRRLAPGDTFVDVGANIGYYSLLASRLVGASGTVVAIEPSPRTFSKLNANMTLNGLSNVRTVNLAASACDGIVQIFRGDEHSSGLTTIIERKGFELECEVSAAPLSSILRPEEMRNTRLVKIDVEGAEWSVVAGMASLINKGRRDLEIIIEVDTDRLAHQGKTPDDLLRPFLTTGFYPYAVENDYSALSYIPLPPYKRPQRIKSPIRGLMDLVLSRQASEHL
jgi:FkbM family methyltransferase